MAENNTTFFGELFNVGLYKRTQGKIIRQATFFALLIMFVVGGWHLKQFLEGTLSLPDWTQSQRSAFFWSLFAGVSVVGTWISYRLVNLPRFADFLIHVEGEFNKISWPSQTELYKSVIVVIFVMVLLALSMWFFDVFWQFIFQYTGVIHAPKV
jgi:preprotein translocase subunit SecE